MDPSQGAPFVAPDGVAPGEEETRRSSTSSEATAGRPSLSPQRDGDAPPRVADVTPSDMSVYRRAYSWWQEQMDQDPRANSSSRREGRPFSGIGHRLAEVAPR